MMQVNNILANHNLVRQITDKNRAQFLIGFGEYFVTDIHGTQAPREIYDKRFESGLRWLYANLGKPMPKIVYSDNLSFLRETTNNKVDITLNHTMIEEMLQGWITVDLDRYKQFRQDYDIDTLIRIEFGRPYLSIEGFRFDLFLPISLMLYELQYNSFSLCMFLQEVMKHTICNELWNYQTYATNTNTRRIIRTDAIEHVKNLCNADVFHIFFGKDVVYALRYPYYRSSWNTKMSALTNGSGGDSSFETFRPRFYWPYGPKIYATDKQILPNWIFEEYLQIGYSKKIMDVADMNLRMQIFQMIRRRSGEKALMDMFLQDTGDEEIATYYYLRSINPEIEQNEIFLGATMELIAKGEGDQRLRDFIKAGFGKEDVLEYYMRHMSLKKVYGLFS